MNWRRSPLSYGIGNLETVFLVPVGGDKGAARYSARLIRCQVNGASLDNGRAKHSDSTITGNVFYRLGGDDPSGIQTIHLDVIRSILQRQHLCQPFDTKLGRGIRTS